MYMYPWNGRTDRLISIGAKTDYHATSDSVRRAFEQSADMFRFSRIKQLEKLINRGTRVAFVHGDA
jgi:hypothetical protein